MKSSKLSVVIFLVGFVFISCIVCASFAVEKGTPLPDTGQTESYTVTSGEDSDYLINPPSYTKLDAAGNDLPNTATEWVMVRDNVTQLIWEVKTDDGSIHDRDNAYYWRSHFWGWSEVLDFIKAVNAENFGGYSDWRMPDMKELTSIVDLGRCNPAINTDFFPNTVCRHFWSSTTYWMATDNTLCVEFGSGDDGYIEKWERLYVRAVRTGQ